MSQLNSALVFWILLGSLFSRTGSGKEFSRIVDIHPEALDCMSDVKQKFVISRRDFLSMIPVAYTGVLLSTLPKEVLALQYIGPIDPALNPLQTYPNRDWEKIYRDIYTPDSTYHYLCAPNDTHGCLLRASVKNETVMYADPSFGYNKATDAYGNKASARWDPRACKS